MRIAIPMILASIVLLGCPTLSVRGLVLDASTGLPIPGAQVGFFRTRCGFFGCFNSSTPTNTTTPDAEGNYVLSHPPNRHALRAWAPGYRSEWADYTTDQAGPLSLRAIIDFDLTYVEPILGVWEVTWTYDDGESCSGDTFEIRVDGLFIGGDLLTYTFDGVSVLVPYSYLGTSDNFIGFFDIDLTFDETTNTLRGPFQYEGIYGSCRTEGTGTLTAGSVNGSFALVNAY